MRRFPVELLDGDEDQKGRNPQAKTREHASDVGIAVDVRGIAPRLEPGVGRGRAHVTYTCQVATCHGYKPSLFRFDAVD